MWPSEFVTYGSITHTRIRFRYSKKCPKGNAFVTQETQAEKNEEPIAARFLCPSPPKLPFQALG